MCHEPFAFVDLRFFEFEILREQTHGIVRHGGLHGDPHRESDVPVLDGVLDGGHEVAGFVYRHIQYVIN